MVSTYTYFKNVQMEGDWEGVERSAGEVLWNFRIAGDFAKDIIFRKKT